MPEPEDPCVVPDNASTNRVGLLGELELGEDPEGDVDGTETEGTFTFGTLTLGVLGT